MNRSILNVLLQFRVHKPTKQLKRYTNTFEIDSFSVNLLEKGPDTTVRITKEEAIQFYHQMASIRRMEQVISELYKTKAIRGFCHLYSGQEAIAVGLSSAMQENDDLITAYRTHGYSYIFDDNQPDSTMGELVGIETGNSLGKGGSMHMYAKNFYGGNGIVGAQVPLGVGLGLAHQQREDKGVAFTLYGDGAAVQGQGFEAHNIAKLWQLPVVFVCENNLYGMGTASKRSSANPDYYRISTYLPGILVNGMDVLAVRTACLFAKRFIADGKGPIILEMRCYRYFGHSMSDPGSSYRSREEIQKVRDLQDPIKMFGDRLTKNGLASAEELKKITTDVRQSLNQAFEKVKSGKSIGMEHLTSDVYAKSIEKHVRGVHIYRKHSHANLGKLVHPNVHAKKT